MLSIIRKSLKLQVSDAVIEALLSAKTYVNLFGRSRTGRIKLKRFRKIILEVCFRFCWFSGVLSHLLHISHTSQRKQAGLPRKTPNAIGVAVQKLHQQIQKCVKTSCNRKMFEALDKAAADKLKDPKVRHGRRKTDFGCKGGAHIALYGSPARKPIEKQMSAHQAADEVKKKLRINFKSLTAAFRAADKDKSGSISPRELRVMLTRLGITVSDVEFTKFLRHYDDVLADDGKIDFREFRQKVKYILFSI